MTGRPAPTHLDVDVGGGLRLHVERAGNGPPVVMLHGFTGSTATWHGLRDALPERFTTILVDLPGHGGSGAPQDATRYALPRFADDLARVLDVLDVPRAAVLGYSLGGRAALRFALAHPARVTALLLESASPGIADEDERAARRAADAALADLLEREGVAAFVAKWERLPLWASQERLPDSARGALRAQRLRNDAGGLAGSLRGAGAGEDRTVTDLLPRLAMPALLVAGALDPKYVALGETMAAALPRARLAIVPDAGHAVHLERPDAFRALVAEFLVSAGTG